MSSRGVERSASVPGSEGERLGRSDLLKHFAVEHRTRFPMLIRVLDWDLPATSLDHHQVWGY